MSPAGSQPLPSECTTQVLRRRAAAKISFRCGEVEAVVLCFRLPTMNPEPPSRGDLA